MLSFWGHEAVAFNSVTGILLVFTFLFPGISKDKELILPHGGYFKTIMFTRNWRFSLELSSSCPHPSLWWKSPMVGRQD